MLRIRPSGRRPPRDHIADDNHGIPELFRRESLKIACGPGRIQGPLDERNLPIIDDEIDFLVDALVTFVKLDEIALIIQALRFQKTLLKGDDESAGGFCFVGEEEGLCKRRFACSGQKNNGVP